MLERRWQSLKLRNNSSYMNKHPLSPFQLFLSNATSILPKPLSNAISILPSKVLLDPSFKSPLKLLKKNPPQLLLLNPSKFSLLNPLSIPSKNPPANSFSIPHLLPHFSFFSLSNFASLSELASNALFSVTFGELFVFKSRAEFAELELAVDDGRPGCLVLRAIERLGWSADGSVRSV